MTNLQFYAKTADALKAWVAYCKNLIIHSSEEPKAFDVWCSQECFDAQPKTESRKRRPFTAKELAGLLGKTVALVAANDHDAEYTSLLGGFTTVMPNRPNVFLAGNWYGQEDLIKRGCTIDGKQWGVEV